VTAGILANDGDADDISASLRNMVSTQLSGGAIKSLEDLGIVSNGYDNTLSLGDGTQLDAALTNQLSQVQSLFTSSTNGIAANLSSYLDKTIGDNGTLITKQGNLSKQASDIDTQIADMERNIQAYKDRLTEEFTNMETAQAKINQQMSYLSQSFGSASLIPSSKG
jgi:flagellar capping protein FliD